MRELKESNKKVEVQIKTSDSLSLALADEKLECIGCDNRFNIYPEFLIYEGTKKQVEDFENLRTQLKQKSQ